VNSARAAHARGRLVARLRAKLPLKVTVLLGLAVGICVPYFTLQRLHWFPLRRVPETWLDRAVGFEPSWIVPYLSIALLVPLMPLMARRRAELLRYALGLFILCAACFAAFLVIPVEGPRPALPPAHDAYRLMVDYDRAANSMPSLHAGLVAYSFLFGYRVLRDELGVRGRIAYAAAATLWGGLILYSTLATKQHWAVDLPVGIAIAAAADAWVWRKSRREP